MPASDLEGTQGKKGMFRYSVTYPFKMGLKKWNENWRY